MKNFQLTLVPMGIALLVAGCGGGGSTSSNTGGGIPTAAVQITSSNATTVAKGAMTPSQSTAQTGSGMAGVVGVVVQPVTRSRSIREIALAEFARARSMKFPPATVVGATQMSVSNCATSGTMTLTLNDANNSQTFDVGDSYTIAFSNCVGNGYTDNGSMTFSISSLSGGTGVAGSTGTPQAPFVTAFTLTFNNYSSTYLSSTESINGDISFSTSDDGTNTTATMYGTSLTVSSTAVGTSSMTNYSISYTGANTPTTSTPYSFSVQMTVADSTMGGSVTISTPTAFTGVGISNPTAGQMVITGANNSTLTLTANSDGLTLTMVVDEDGAAGPIAPVALPDTTWTAI
ncbi:MAG: hypothetical protein HZB47_04100 [Nitrosomonadales bacterium]|nr:hypothetical protein [Nitrosomonadales bacterium]